MISIHPPRAGRDRLLVNDHFALADFNPPAPCGAGHCCYLQTGFCFSISIHPPRAGRDDGGYKLAETDEEFQSTRPVRGGTLSQVLRCLLSAFQSTRPVRGGTQMVQQFKQFMAFQSTRPVRGGTGGY